jgi:outer membrane immunogenic protein
MEAFGMKRLLPAGLTALAMATTMTAAQAADMPSRPVEPAPSYVSPAYNWTGAYIGVNGGYGWGRSEWLSGGASTGQFDVNGGLVGGTLGYNWQTGPLVLGLEGDADWSSIKGDTSNSFCVGVVCETRNNWLGTARGRIGYAFGRVMPYVTGGLAVGDIKASAAGGSTDTTNTGWTLGGGVEAAIRGPWTAKLEYLYTDLGSGNCDVTVCGTSSDVDFRGNMVRAGINYHF